MSTSLVALHLYHAPTPSLLAIRLRRESIVTVSRASNRAAVRNGLIYLQDCRGNQRGTAKTSGKSATTRKPSLTHHRSIKRVRQSKSSTPTGGKDRCRRDR